MDFKKVYKLPLKQWEGMDKVFTADSHMAFDFLRKYKGDEDTLHINEESKVKVLSILNGETEGTITAPLKHEEGYVWLKKDDSWHKFILIRGWGHLTGCGGLKLPPEKAAKIQDDFGNWIVETLQKK